MKNKLSSLGLWKSPSRSLSLVTTTLALWPFRDFSPLVTLPTRWLCSHGISRWKGDLPATPLPST